MRKLLCLVVISAFFAGTASAEHGDVMSKDIENNIHYQGQIADPDRLINDGEEPAVKLTEWRDHPGHTCVIEVQEVDSGMSDYGRLSISKGTKIDGVRDFPTGYEIMQKGEENIGGWDGGAPKIYNTLSSNPGNVEIRGDVEANFPLKCLENSNGNAEWVSVGGSQSESSDSSSTQCDEGEIWNQNLGGCVPEDTDTSSGTGSDTDTGSGDGGETEYETLDQKTIKGVTCDSTTEYTSVDYEGKSYSCNCDGVCEWQRKVEGSSSSEDSGTDTSSVGSGGELDSGNGETYDPSDQLNLDLTRTEWAALASVDPDYITEENATNLNGAYATVGQAAKKGREAAVANGWKKESDQRLNTLADLAERKQEAGQEGVTGPGQNMQAADGQYLVTDGTASPYSSDGCYSGVDFEPVPYGQGGGYEPPTFSGPDWKPGSYNCPSWMKGGDRIFYEGDVLTLDWSKLESLRGSEQEGSSGTGTGQSEPVTNLEVSAESITGFSWKGYCINNADSIGIKTKDGISTGEAVKCIKPCWGASKDEETPQNQDATCGQLVEDFCNPYYNYNKGTNKCER